MNDTPREHDKDLDLLCAWQTGNAAAGNQLCRRFDAKLRRFFRTKVPPHEVNELVQQTWLALTQASRRVRAAATSGGDPAGGMPLQIHTTFRAYLLGAARHVVLNHYRKNRRDGDFDPEVDSVEALVPSLSRQLSLQRKVKQIESVLQGLPIELQLLAEARYVEELTGPELAEVFGIPEGTVRSRLAKARELIDRALERMERHLRPACERGRTASRR